ncbi:MAG: hypothetical protein PHE26_12985 [Syntrophomonadaceae bacterium]|nr:hypothetical protein [Syntrophomonadaceae bacterium]
MKLEDMFKAKAKENLSNHTNQGYQKSDKAIHTAKELAKVAGVSHDTIHKVKTIEQKAPVEIKQNISTGNQ